MTIDKRSPKSFSSLVTNYDFRSINLYWLLLIVKTASYTYRIYVAVKLKSEKYLGLSAIGTRQGALRYQCSAVTTGFSYCDTGFSALNSNRGKRTRKRPNWLDNCTWLGISSERLACCGKGTCHGSQSTVSVVSPTSRFANKSIRLHRGRFAYTTKSFRLHGLSRFAYTYKSKCFVKMDEHHCLQLASF